MEKTVSEIPSAEEFADGILGEGDYPTNTPYAMIEFAKLHVKAALEAASEKAIIKYEDSSQSDYKILDKHSILKSYPLENIK